MIALEKLFDNSIAQRNFDKVAQAAIDAGQDPTTGAPRQVSIRFGTVTNTFTASATSDSVNVDHGLGREPVAVYVSPRNAGVHPAAFVASATQITVQSTNDSSITGARDIHWLVIG